jgi:hypothetical protein
MAYSNSTSDRMDELRFRSQQTARNDSPLLGLVSPPRNGARLPPPTHSQDGRASLTRRFTTDSGRVPTLNSIASPNQRVQDGGQEYPPSVSRIALPPYSLLFTARQSFSASIQRLFIDPFIFPINDIQ